MLGVVDVATGQVAGDYRYDAFGARTVTGEAIRYGFTGREHDASGLIYFRARHFDPQTGKFLQPDPIGFAAGDLNIYAYVWNDPFNWTDPSGLMSWAERSVITAGNIGMAGAVAGIRNAVLNLANQIARALRPNIVRQAAGGGGGAGGGGDDDGGDDDDCRPNDPGCQEENECLSAETQRAIRSYERQIAQHEAKIAEFRANPTVKPEMEGLPEEMIRAQQARRIWLLEKEIEKFRNNIDKLRCR